MQELEYTGLAEFKVSIIIATQYRRICLICHVCTYANFPRASRFAGYKQQDSQELLRYLLDSLRSEEIDVRMLQSFLAVVSFHYWFFPVQRIKHAILKSFGVSKTSINQLTDAQKGNIRGMEAPPVDDVMIPFSPLCSIWNASSDGAYLRG